MKRSALGGRVLALLAVSVAGWLAGPPAPRARAADDPVLAYARDKLFAGAYREAAEAAAAVLEEEPRNAAALQLAVRAALAQGREDEAQALLAQAEVAAPLEVALWRARLLAARAPAQAEAVLRQQLARSPESLRLHAALAELLVARGEREQATEHARRCFELYRRTATEALGAEELLALARAARAAERLPALAREHIRPFAEEARRFYQQAWRIGQDPAVLVEWAELYLEKWDLPEARRLLRRVLERNPRDPDANALLAETHLEDLYSGTESYERAHQAIAAALATDPRHVRALVLRAEMLIGDALYDEALAALEQALARAPQQPRALGAQLAALELAGRSEPAAALRARLAAQAPPAMRAEVHRRLAGHLDRRYRYREAYLEARQALEADAEYWPAYGQLGLAAMRVGEEAQARAVLERAHQADPYDLFVYNMLELLEVLERRFVTFETEHFTIRLDRDEAPWLRPYLEPFAERAWRELAARYGVQRLEGRILLEVFPHLEDFSVRAAGHRFIPASGVTFWRVVALASPAAFPPGTHGWAQVLWHELAHVAALERSGYRVPRWLTEGISVLEESKGDPAWVRSWDVALRDALARDQILGVLELDQGFSKPRFPGQVMLSYYQGGMICRWLEQLRGMEAILALLDACRAGTPMAVAIEQVSGMAPAEFDARFRTWLAAQLGAQRYRPAVRSAEELSQLAVQARRRPDDVQALAHYALGCADLGRWADAEIAAGRLLELDPQSGDARLVDARLALHRGQKDRALALFAEALALGSCDPLAAHLGRARLLAERDPAAPQRRDLRRALAELEAARRLLPRSLEVLHALRQLLGELGEQQRRREIEEEIAALSPNDFELWMELAQRALAEGRLEEARRRLEQVLWVEPRHPLAHAELAQLYARLDVAPERIERELAVLAVLDPEDALTSRTRTEVERLRTGRAAGGATGPAPPSPTAEPAPAPALPGGAPRRAGPLAPAPAARPSR
ncbi:MAG: hypothetical protein KatS3mg102_1692 [Planctomycetota bacterium]|nr:MAG: hypothetical protein KatS3mg102_1692 [Planctomycetota bacterium]